MLYHEEFLDDPEVEEWYDGNFENGTYWFDRWPAVYP